jgi:hypothetical protein
MIIYRLKDKADEPLPRCIMELLSQVYVKVVYDRPQPKGQRGTPVYHMYVMPP